MRQAGAPRSENAGMSNEFPNERLGPLKSKGSLAMSISEGLVGPKVRLKSVADGQTVNIPLPSIFTDGVTEFDNQSVLLV